MTLRRSLDRWRISAAPSKPILRRDADMPRTKLPWRRHLTDHERELITASDALLLGIKKMKENHERRYATQRRQIVNRAIKRAKLAASLGQGA